MSWNTKVLLQERNLSVYSIIDYEEVVIARKVVLVN